MAHPFEVPAQGAVEYQYFIVPTGFNTDRWVTAAEVRPRQSRGGSSYCGLHPRARRHLDAWADQSRHAHGLHAGSTPDVLPSGMAKFIKAGSDLVFEIHYTPNGKPTEDLTQVGMIFAASPPQKRVLTLADDEWNFRDSARAIPITG